jgi:N6-adenosine-specific RNA methylase IME4
MAAHEDGPARYWAASAKGVPGGTPAEISPSSTGVNADAKSLHKLCNEAAAPLIAAGPFAGLPRHHFAVVLADPPQHYTTWSDQGQGRSPSQHYATLTIVELMTWPIAELAADDCWLWLWLWLSGVHLPAVADLMRSWGFKYSGVGLTWLKMRRRWQPNLFGGFATSDIHFGLGHTTRKSTETCFLGRRGQPKRVSRSVREVIVAPIREHSRKPDEQYERIESFCEGPRLEIFARQRVNGWRSWGAEVDKFTNNRVKGG